MGIKLEKSVGRPVDIILGNEQKCLKVLPLETQVLSFDLEVPFMAPIIAKAALYCTLSS